MHVYDFYSKPVLFVLLFPFYSIQINEYIYITKRQIAH